MSKKIAIIGGGISGLAVGYYASRAGFDVSVFEKENECGGLLGSIDLGDGIGIEKYYHHIFPSDKHFIDLLSDLGLQDTLGWHNSSTSIFMDRKYYPFSKVTDYLFIPGLTILEKARFLAGGYIFSKKTLPSIIRLKAEEAIKKYMGAKVWDKLWGPLFNKKFGADTQDVLASWFWWRMNVKLKNKFRKEELGYLRGGFKVLIDSLKKEIEIKNGRVNTSMEVKSVVKRKNDFCVDGDIFDLVIFTIPNQQINNIYKNKCLDIVKYRSVINLVLVLSKSQTNYYWNNIVDVDIPFVGVIEHTNLVGKKEYKGRAVIYLTQYIDEYDDFFKMSDKDVFDNYKKYFAEVGINEKDIISFYVSRDKYAQPIVKTPPKDSGFMVMEENVYSVSMEHVYPEDRGLNQAIGNAQRLVEFIS